jgi:hypothetical protein
VAIAEIGITLRRAPGFAKAWSTLAMAHYVLSNWAFSGHRNDKGVLEERAAEDAARHALALDPSDGEALGIEAVYQPRGHLVQTGQLLERALRTAPHDTQILNWHAAFLMIVGRTEGAGYEYERAYALDRVTPAVAFNLAGARLQAGEFDGVEAILDLERDAFNQEAVFDRRFEYYLLRRDWGALASLVRVIPTYIPSDRVQSFRVFGDAATALARRDVAQFPALRARLRSDTGPDPDYTAQFLTALGDKDGALDAIQAAVTSERSGNLLQYSQWGVLFSPELAALRRSPRVPELLARWGLFDYWRTSGQWPDICGEPGLSFDCKAEVRKNASPAHS